MHRFKLLRCIKVQKFTQIGILMRGLGYGMGAGDLIIMAGIIMAITTVVILMAAEVVDMVAGVDMVVVDMVVAGVAIIDIQIGYPNTGNPVSCVSNHDRSLPHIVEQRHQLIHLRAGEQSIRALRYDVGER